MLSNESLESCVSPGRAPTPVWSMSVLGKGREQEGEEFSVLSKFMVFLWPPPHRGIVPVLKFPERKR